MEFWDLYDKDRNKLDKIVKRGDRLEDDEYHLVINAWIRNSKGEFLITQRAPNKSFPYMWECTGGSALKDETSLDACVREIKEELGIDIDKTTGKLLGSTLRYYSGCPDILDVWVFEDNTDVCDVVTQEEEVCNVMWATPEKIRELYVDGKFEANPFFENALNSLNVEDVYYIGFNANNAICNDFFFAGSITLYPTKEKGNIYFSDTLLADTKSEVFMAEYRKYIYKTAREIQDKNPNARFICFNAKIRRLCEGFDDINIVKENDEEIVDFLNDKFKTRDFLKDIVQLLEYKEVDGCELDYNYLKSMFNDEKFVVQAAFGSGGSSTYFIDSQEMIDKVVDKSLKYNVSRYVKNIPLNITMIVGEYNILSLPISTQLISVIDNKFKYVGGDFVHANMLEKSILESVLDYGNKIAEKVKGIGYRGILGIDFVLCEDGKIYFMEINPRFQASTFVISRYLKDNSGTNVAELHYNALKGLVVGPVKVPEIKQSFVNCNTVQTFGMLKEDDIVDKGYFEPNTSSVFRKIFNRSVFDCELFEKI